MREFAKIHLQQSRISKFSGEDPRTPLSRGGEGRRGQGKGKGRREGKDRGGTGRDMGGEEWGVGRGGEGLDMGSAPPPPLKTSSGSAPDDCVPVICSFVAALFARCVAQRCSSTHPVSVPWLLSHHVCPSRLCSS